mmetsp:Transcript_13991/g.58426  ORF Transcript_13991/g.58426 Transcript_13991/m.58426 type:complete len:203 (+) Transcript_13991:218-826(+)
MASLVRADRNEMWQGEPSPRYATKAVRSTGGAHACSAPPETATAATAAPDLAPPPGAGAHSPPPAVVAAAAAPEAAAAAALSVSSRSESPSNAATGTGRAFTASTIPGEGPKRPLSRASRLMTPSPSDAMTRSGSAATSAGTSRRPAMATRARRPRVCTAVPAPADWPTSARRPESRVMPKGPSTSCASVAFTTSSREAEGF